MYNTHIILDLEMNPVLETNKKARKVLKSEIIEIGAIKLDKHLNIIDRFKLYVCPEYNHQITPKIMRLTGIHTSTVLEAKTFEHAMEEFVEWIGADPKTRIYSWSSNDLTQIKNEGKYKGVPFPDCMNKWLDLQKVFPRMMRINGKRIALKEAVRYFDIDFNKKEAHDALYDAEITTQLLIYFLNGKYKKQVKCVNSFIEPNEAMNSLGDACGGVLLNLLREMQEETAIA